MFLSVALVALGLSYGAVILRFASGFRKLTATWKPVPPARYPSVSVIVAARNEADHIAPCVESILRNDYPKELLDVTVVDDRSEDDTSEIVSRLAQREPRLHLIRLAESGTGEAGKRAAIRSGVDRSEADVILLTDADSRVQPNWIRTMVATFEETVLFVSGAVAYESGSGLLHQLLELELLGLVAVGAGGIAKDRPNMCNGANVAFRRATFQEVGGYAGTEGLTSGDDELLMQKVARMRSGSVAFCPDPLALVSTRAPRGIAALFQQRRRWASKGLHYPEVRITLLALLVYAFNFTLLAVFVGAFWLSALWPVLLAALLIKILAELWMLWNVCRHFGRLRLVPLTVVGQLLQIPYVVIVGAAGTLGGYMWKGRETRR